MRAGRRRQRRSLCVHACVCTGKRASVREGVRARVCVCVREGVRESVLDGVRACVRAGRRACVCACMRAGRQACVRTGMVRVCRHGSCVQVCMRAGRRAGVRACVRACVNACVIPHDIVSGLGPHHVGISSPWRSLSKHGHGHRVGWDA